MDRRKSVRAPGVDTRELLELMHMAIVVGTADSGDVDTVGPVQRGVTHLRKGPFLRVGAGLP